VAVIGDKLAVAEGRPAAVADTLAAVVDILAAVVDILAAGILAAGILAASILAAGILAVGILVVDTLAAAAGIPAPVLVLEPPEQLSLHRLRSSDHEQHSLVLPIGVVLGYSKRLLAGLVASPPHDGLLRERHLQQRL